MEGRDQRSNGVTGRLRSLRSFCSHLGLNYNGIVRGEERHVAEVAQLLGYPVTELLDRRVLLLERGCVEFRGTAFFDGIMRRAPIQFCPDCLDDDERQVDRMPGTRGYARFLWTLACVGACPRHARLLVPLPEKSSDPFELNFLINVLPVADPSAPADRCPVTRFERFVIERLGGTVKHGELLDRLTLPMCIEVCENIGMATVFGQSYDCMEASRRMLREARDSGFATLELGEGGVNDFLAHLASGIDADRALSGKELYGRLVGILNRRPQAYGELGAIFNSHALSRYPRVSPASIFAGDRKTRTPVADIADASNVSVSTVYRYLRQHRLIKSTTVVQYDGPVGIDVGNAAIVALRNAMIFEETRALLQCSSPELQSLVMSGVITALIGKPHLSGRFETHDRYLRGQVTGLRSRLIACANSDPTKLVSLRAAIASVGCELADALRPILDGRMQNVGFETAMPLMDGLRIDPLELGKTLGLRTMLGAAHVRVQLHLKQLALKELVAMGLIRALVDDHLNPIAVYPESVKTFARRYVTIDQVAVSYGSDVATTRALITTMGVTQVYPENLSIVEIYHRSDLPQIPKQANPNAVDLDGIARSMRCHSSGPRMPMWSPSLRSIKAGNSALRYR